ncbi:hypothetical protein PFISCL1PPCAC_26297, partial [Pristionchus fissidentatus]
RQIPHKELKSELRELPTPIALPKHGNYATSVFGVRRSIVDLVKLTLERLADQSLLKVLHWRPVVVDRSRISSPLVSDKAVVYVQPIVTVKHTVYSLDQCLDTLNVLMLGAFGGLCCAHTFSMKTVTYTADIELCQMPEFFVDLNKSDTFWASLTAVYEPAGATSHRLTIDANFLDEKCSIAKSMLIGPLSSAHYVLSYYGIAPKSNVFEMVPLPHGFGRPKYNGPTGSWEDLPCCHEHQ